MIRELGCSCDRPSLVVSVPMVAGRGHISGLEAQPRAQPHWGVFDRLPCSNTIWRFLYRLFLLRNDTAFIRGKRLSPAMQGTFGIGIERIIGVLWYEHIYMKG